jgi:YhcH/YjgK/YiaL family protein
MKRLNIEDLKVAYPDAYEFLSTHDMVSLEEKRYELGNRAYVNVESYDTYKFVERRYESHIKYVDIQCIIVGRENIIIEPVKNLSVVEEYNPEKDIAFYKNNIHGVDNIMKAGDMLLLEPADGHMPCVAIEESVHVKKAVFKFLVT